MEILLQIPAQPKTNGIPREMTLSAIDFQNGIIADARDGKTPGRIRFEKGDRFPWDQFLQRLAVLWHLSRNDGIPSGFRLRKPLPPEISEQIPRLTSREALEVLLRLNKAGFIRAFHAKGG